MPLQRVLFICHEYPTNEFPRIITNRCIIRKIRIIRRFVGVISELYIMTRSSKKGPYVDERVLKKIEGKKPLESGVIKTWSRACVISPEMIGFTFGVHNGKTHLEVLVSEDMVGHRLGEFSPTKKFIKHGGKMQKELEIKKKESEIAAAQSAKAVGADATK